MKSCLLFLALLLPAQAFAGSNFVQAAATDHLITAYDQEHIDFREGNPGVRVDVVDLKRSIQMGNPSSIIVRTLEMDCRGSASIVHSATWHGQQGSPRPISISVELHAPRPYQGTRLWALEGVLCRGRAPGPSLGFSPLDLRPKNP